MTEYVEGIRLRRTDENAEEIAALLERSGGSAGVEGVLDHLNRTASAARVLGRAARHGFRWNAQDQDSADWWPQGITTSADATDTEDIAGRKVLVTSWYSKHKQGSRLTFVDLASLRYRHVLLVVPERGLLGGLHLKPLNVHAGGIVWCGPNLHVAGTRRGLYTCHLDDLARVDPSEETFGYRYVLPVRSAYEAHADDGYEALRYSFLSLDRSASPPQLVAGEYGINEMTTRLARYPLDPETWELHAGDDGFSRPVKIDDRGVGHMQGAAIVDGTYYVTVSRGARMLGSLYVGEPGNWRRHRFTLPIGPEDITYWPSTGQLWSLSEYPGRRFVFAMDRGRWRGPQGHSQGPAALRTGRGTRAS